MSFYKQESLVLIFDSRQYYARHPEKQINIKDIP